MQPPNYAHFKHLSLTQWPFSVVPRSEHCTFIAGRPQLVEDLATLLRNLSRRDTSSIHLLWSWFGAGKTHSLFYLANQARSTTGAAVKLLPVYTEFPKEARGFIDLYRGFIARLNQDDLINAYLDLSTAGNTADFERSLFQCVPDLSAALRVLSIGEPRDKVLAARWLRGDNLPSSEFRKVGITQRVTSTEQATQITGTIFRILSDAAKLQNKQGARVIWMLDEFQRLSGKSRSVVSDVNAGLHSLFNMAPTGFSPIISFSGMPDPKRLPEWLTDEIKDRIGATKVLILPPLQPGEALLFVRDVLKHFRIPDASVHSDYYPFTEESCAAIIELVAKKSDLRPRVVMHAFNAVLETLEPRIENATLSRITRDAALEALSEFSLTFDDGEAEQS